ncbi:MULTISPECIES: cytochrome o ubiquinol oxidase subunit IV [Methylobacillus]|uniref:Cytochrome bo(3) ubiquinol oxidase subunit 4 n=1 Tax=Methylobacillus flagellatus (strain ATCC 51484 / DSM 6875 / VKM B-1610 / KT) TaxID=265072 RepID=Q1H1S7_METFK|nr:MULTISPECIES: cytochrome o ubiquinol oxidase subunit IV [Methylobacillus]ABE49560.1 cytochrome bo3 quinol oxidase subunit 4 [Methylobacillus flagellatus KT]MPS47901.1 cytochrome o ubiquinol oxidase subunit IV [Methylobacillus sp.]
MSHGHVERAGAGHASVKSYIIGFVLSVILTVIPFGLLMFPNDLSSSTILVTILVFAVVQIVVHLVYFLHMNTSSEQSWNVMAFIFTVIILAIVVVGSLWVMFHLNHNMMRHF